MELLRDTPFEVAFVTTLLTPPRSTFTVVVKATFALPAEGVCAVASEQLPVSADVHVDDDVARPLLAESDLAPVKPRGECFVRGASPAVPGAVAAFAVGAVKKVVATPERPTPIDCGPIVRTAASRVGLAGSFDGTWHRDRWPFLPADHDIAYHLASPLDQRAEGYWSGDEEVVLRNLVPKRDLVRARLPGLTVRAFALRSAEGEPEAIVMRLDTLTVDIPAARVVALWRGATTVASERLEDLHGLVVWHEPLTARSDVSHARARIAAMRAKEKAELAGHAPEAIPALDDDDEDALRGTVKFQPPDDAAAREEAAEEKAIEAALADIAKDAPPAPEDPPAPPPTADELRAAAVELGLPPDAFAEPPQAKPEPPPRDPTSREWLLAARAAGASTAGMDLTNADLRGCDLAKADLTGCIFTGADLTDARLDRAKLTRASLANTKLTRASFAKADLTGADLTGAGGEAVVFTGATLTSATLTQAMLAGASLAGARLDRVEGREADFTGADLRGAVLDGADLSGAQLSGANAAGASLVATSLEGAHAPNIDLTKADVTKLRASEGAVLTGAKLREVKGAGGIYSDASLEGADLSYSDFGRAELSRAKLTGACLDGCDLRGARAVGATMARVQMRRANAMELNLEAADLADADLRGTNLYGASLWKARVVGARFEQALLGGTLLAATAATLGAR